MSAEHLSPAVLRDASQPGRTAHLDAVGAISRLILRCGRGDEAALGQLFDVFYGPVAAALSRSAGTRCADDAVVRAFVRLWRHAPTYHPQDQNPVEWVMLQTRASSTSPGSH